MLNADAPNRYITLWA